MRGLYKVFANYVLCVSLDRLLFFRSLEHSAYLGLENGSKAIDKDIIDQGHVVDFEKFLNEAGTHLIEFRDWFLNNDKPLRFVQI
jgi:hypothetical protein